MIFDVAKIFSYRKIKQNDNFWLKKLTEVACEINAFFPI